MTELLLTAIFTLLAMGISMLIYNVLPDFEKLNLSRRFTDELGAGRTPPALFKIFRLPILMFADLATSMEMTKQRPRYASHLQSLGLEKVVSVDQLIALKLTVFSISVVYAVMLLAVLPFFFCLA